MEDKRMSKRLCVRLLTEADEQQLIAFEQRNREIIERIAVTRAADYYDSTVQSARMKELVARQRAREQFCFVITDSGQEQIIGRIDVMQLNYQPFARSAMLGYVLDLAAQGQGIMYTALSQVLDYVFDELQLHRVTAGAQPTNGPSCRLLERLGFTCEGLERQNVQIAGVWTDHYRFVLLARDERKSK